MPHHISAHAESHFSSRNNWLRASVLGANDGLISTASLLMGLASAHANSYTILLTGLAALVSGAVSMAAGEYVSVSSQADTEKVDLQKEAFELKRNPERELVELAEIYRHRGLDRELAHRVAVALTEHNALEAHARDEIGLSEILSANPFQAAFASAASFCIGALPPVLLVWWRPESLWLLGGLTVSGLAVLGAISAKLGGAPIFPAVRRIVLWGVVALVVTMFIGQLFDIKI